ncbi:MAG: hypothetical protein OXG92_06615, partial [Chloroflexi bacterium]|nr:hypothetical protein [Chloroflexota bacterium]
TSLNTIARSHHLPSDHYQANYTGGMQLAWAEIIFTTGSRKLCAFVAKYFDALALRNIRAQLGSQA